MSRSRTAALRRASPTLVALAAAACAGEPSPAVVATTAQALPPCVLERRPLVAEDGTEIYVEYQDLVLVGDEIMEAGAPSYHWRPVSGGPAARLSSNAFVAVYVGPPARPVPNPIPSPIEGTLASVRVAALDDRRWGAVLHQVEPDSLPGIEFFRGLWYGEFDGERWTHLEELEPTGSRLTSRISSGLVRAGDRLLWLGWELTQEVTGSRVWLYERVGGAWSRSMVPDVDRVESVALDYHEQSGLWMLLSGYDASLPGFQKSLRLYRERVPLPSNARDRWELVSRVALVEQGMTVRTAHITAQPNGAAVSWSEAGEGRSRARAQAGIGGDAPDTLVTLDDGAYAVFPAVMPDGSMAWLVEHLVFGTIATELRLLRLENGEVARVTSFPSPFTAGLAVRAAAPDELVVVGPEMGSDSTDVPVRSLLLRLSTSC